MERQIKDLKYLYSQISKHSNYQILAECFKPFLKNEDIRVKSRYEKERLTYILQHVDPVDKSALDIGGNSGYFSFELLGKGVRHVDYYEGNPTHAEFVKLSSELLGYSDKLEIFNQYFNFEKDSTIHYDITLLLNVLHHVGDDYGDKDLSIIRAKQKIIESLNMMAAKTNILVFQLGFCWKGNRKLLLFENGTKEEMINFIKEGTEENWFIEEIAIPERKDNEIYYSPLTANNILRQDDLGEFLNRPLFIMKSLK